MKRKFANQSGILNKFWSIKVVAETQIVTWGKIGTKGRENIKHFSDAEECLKDSKKLISKKIKKGYKELLTEEGIPKKGKMSKKEEAEYFFWNCIQKSNKDPSSDWKEYDIDEHLENLTILLSKFGKEKLVVFEKILQEKLNELYSASIAELSIILECSFEKNNDEIIFDSYLSTGGFIYFRCWLLLKGKDFFDDITFDLNSFISERYSFNIEDTWAEGLLYVTDEAYSYFHENNDTSMIRDAVSKFHPEIIDYDSDRNTFDRAIKEGEELHKSYPKIVETICNLRQ
jgi:predicted DNA-binding WGR domain protein